MFDSDNPLENYLTRTKCGVQSCFYTTRSHTTLYFSSKAQPQKQNKSIWTEVTLILQYMTTKPMSNVSLWFAYSLQYPIVFFLLRVWGRPFRVLLQLYVWLHITSNFTCAAQGPLMKTCVKKSNKQIFLPSKGILQRRCPKKLTSAAAASQCHMLLFLQLCKLWDV